MAAKISNLFTSADLCEWNKILVNYKRVLELFCTKKKKKNLLNLDNWFQNELKSFLKERRDEGCPYLTKAELSKLMEWKLTRGKFRPRLTEMVKTNPDKIVDDVSKASFEKISQPDEAIKELCKMKAVGPATASAILTAYCPEKYAFMADEAVASVLTGKIDYTLKYYLAYLEKISKKAKGLSKKDTRVWTPHDIELALWTSKIALQFDIELNEVESSGTKRKSTEPDATTRKKHKHVE